MADRRPALGPAGLNYAVVFGTSLAVVIGLSLWDRSFFLALAAMIVLHSAANMLSDVFDFKRGLDKDVTPVSGAIVRGWFCARGGRIRVRALFGIGTASGLCCLGDGRTLFVIGLVGLVVGVFYTAFNIMPWATWPFSEFRPSGSLGAWVFRHAFFLDSGHLDCPHGDAGRRHPPRQQLAGHHLGRRRRVKTLAALWETGVHYPIMVSWSSDRWPSSLD